MDLERFGQELRELRERRGITQDEVIERTKAYKDSRTLRKVEAGQQQPPRRTVILLVVEGLRERDPAIVDHFLALAGYEHLHEDELARLKLVRSATLMDGNGQVGVSIVAQATVGPDARLAWRILTATSIIAAAVLIVIIRDPFLTVTTLVYSAMYAVSVLLESVYEFRGRNTVLASFTAFAVSWPPALAALWIDKSVAGQAGLWSAYAVIMVSGIGQWLLVQPALSPHPIVPTDYQSHTARAAHLKNSVYFFLFFAFPLWVLPVHCVAFRGHASMTNFLCPHPTLLWILTAVYGGGALIMGRDLLPRLGHSQHHNRYLVLIYTRAILYFLLCLICSAWYAASFQ